MATQFKHTLTQGEIKQMKDKLLSVMSDIHTNKHRIMTHDYRQLNNHLQFALNTLGNMSNILQVEKSDRYGSNNGYTDATGGKRIVYNPDGTTRLIAPNEMKTTDEGWEKQFDENLLMRPPCFQVPPQSLTSIPRINQASDWSMTQYL